MILGFVVEKNTDLPAGDPRRKFKGRVVFQANNVKNQNWEAAVSADLGSTPASMEAGHVVDADAHAASERLHGAQERVGGVQRALRLSGGSRRVDDMRDAILRLQVEIRFEAGSLYKRREIVVVHHQEPLKC
jgi:hypothetical protein